MSNKTTYKIDIKQKGAEKAQSSLRSLAKSAAGLASAYMGVTAAMDFIKGSIENFGVQDLAIRRVEAALKSTKGAAGVTSKELQDLASSLQSVTTFGDEATLEMNALLLTFTNIKGDVLKDAIATVQDMASAMGTDMKTQALMLGKALNDPVAGVAALSRVGVQLTDDQKDQIKSFAAVNDVASAQGVILKELGVQFGGMAQAEAQSFSGQLIQLQNTWGDVMEDFGRHLAESGTMGRMIKWAQDFGEAYAFMFPAEETPTLKPLAEEIDFLNDKLSHQQGLLEQAGENLSFITTLAEMRNISFQEALMAQQKVFNMYESQVNSTKESLDELKNTQEGLTEGTFVQTEAIDTALGTITTYDRSVGAYAETVDTTVKLDADLLAAEKKLIAVKNQAIGVGKSQAGANKTIAASAIDASSAVINSYIQEATASYLKDNVKWFATVPPPFNAILLAAAGAAMSTTVSQLVQGASNYTKEQVGAQYGFEGVVTDPTTFTVGEGGAAEYVSVTPMEGANNATGGLVVNITGNVMSQDFVEGELAEKVQEAVRKGVSFA